jgi:hypothetical protein
MPGESRRCDGAKDRKASCQVFCQHPDNEALDAVEGSTPSEAQEAMAQEEPGMGSPGQSNS